MPVGVDLQVDAGRAYPVPGRPARPRYPILKRMTPPLVTPRFLTMFGFSFLVFVSVFQLLPVAPYRMLALGGTPASAGWFLGLLTISCAVSAPFTGPLCDRIGHRRALIIAGSLLS